MESINTLRGEIKPHHLQPPHPPLSRLQKFTFPEGKRTFTAHNFLSSKLLNMKTSSTTIAFLLSPRPKKSCATCDRKSRKIELEPRRWNSYDSVKLLLPVCIKPLKTSGVRAAKGRKTRKKWKRIIQFKAHQSFRKFERKEKKRKK